MFSDQLHPNPEVQMVKRSKDKRIIAEALEKLRDPRWRERADD